MTAIDPFSVHPTGRPLRRDRGRSDAARELALSAEAV